MIDLNTVLNTLVVVVVSILGAIASYKFTIAKAERLAKENKRIEQETRKSADDLQTTQMNRMDVRIAALEKKVADREARIDELERERDARDKRIAELETNQVRNEATIQMLRVRVSELETRDAEKNRRIAELEKMNAQKDIRIAELEAEVARLKSHEIAR